MDTPMKEPANAPLMAQKEPHKKIFNKKHIKLYKKSIIYNRIIEKSENHNAPNYVKTSMNCKEFFTYLRICFSGKDSQRK